MRLKFRQRARARWQRIYPGYPLTGPWPDGSHPELAAGHDWVDRRMWPYDVHQILGWPIRKVLGRPHRC